MNSTYEIIENLYLGDAKSVSECSPDKIKCLVSLFQCDGVEKWQNNDLFKIQIDDIPTEDILQHLQPSCDFIHSKLTNGEAVLVHCYAGSSRSVSVIIAYLLQREICSSVDEAEKMIADKGGIYSCSPCINSGFLDQLELWSEMGNKINVENSNYKKYQMKKIQESLMLEDGKENLAAIVMTSPEVSDKSCYKCKKCRRNLVRISSILSHLEDTKVKKFVKKNRDQRKPVLQTCSSIFVEPLAWMNEVVQGRNNGCLYCPNPKCGAKVGHFDWSGIQNELVWFIIK